MNEYSKYGGFLKPNEKRLKTFVAIRVLDRNNPYHDIYVKIAKSKITQQVYTLLTDLPEKELNELKNYLHPLRTENIKQNEIKKISTRPALLSFKSDYFCKIINSYCDLKNRKCTNTQYRLHCKYH